MITINTKNAYENFIKRYNGTQNNIKAIKACAGLTLFGAGFENLNLCSAGLAVSLDTIITIRTKEDGIFNLISGDSDIEYECKNSELSKYADNSFCRDMFKICSLLRENIQGAEILVDSDINEELIKRPVSALICALGIINNGSIPNTDTVKALLADVTAQKTGFTEAELYGRKNTLIFKNDSGLIEYLPFSTHGYKAIITMDKKKIIKTDSLVDEAFEDLRTKYPHLKSSSDFAELTHTVTFSDKSIKKYIINECSRIQNIYTELKNNPMPMKSIAKILNDSANELCRILGKPGEHLLEAYKICESTGLSSMTAVLYEYGGICAFTEDNNVDMFCDIFSAEYQKKAGNIPALYICECTDSGVEMMSDVEAE